MTLIGRFALKRIIRSVFDYFSLQINIWKKLSINIKFLAHPFTTLQTPRDTSTPF